MKSAVNNANMPSKTATGVENGMRKLIPPCSGGYFDEVVAHVDANTVTMESLKEDTVKLLEVFTALEDDYTKMLASFTWEESVSSHPLGPVGR